MPIKVSIIGATGTLGSCAAFHIATQGLADELVLIGRNRNVLKCHAMDIESAIAGLRNTVIREGYDEDLSGSDVVIITAGAPGLAVSSRVEKLKENLPIIRQIAEKITRFCPAAVIVTATNPIDPINLALCHMSGLDRRQLLGYSFNDTTRFKMFAAKFLGIQSTRVNCLVIGEHGDSAVLLFSTLTVDGGSLTMSETEKSQIRDSLHNALKVNSSLGTGWSSGWTSAVGLAAIVAAIRDETDALVPCSVLLKGEYGIEGISIGVPVKLGRQGVKEIVELKLSLGERSEFDKSATYLRSICRKIIPGCQK